MINIITLLESLGKSKDNYEKLIEKRKENQELDSYLINDYRISLNHRIVMNTKHNITKSFTNESEIVGLLILIESIIQFIKLSKEYEKINDIKLSRLRKKQISNKKNPGE